MSENFQMFTILPLTPYDIGQRLLFKRSKADCGNLSKYLKNEIEISF